MSHPPSFSLPLHFFTMHNNASVRCDCPWTGNVFKPPLDHWIFDAYLRRPVDLDSLFEHYPRIFQQINEAPAREPHTTQNEGTETTNICTVLLSPSITAGITEREFWGFTLEILQTRVFSGHADLSVYRPFVQLFVDGIDSLKSFVFGPALSSLDNTLNQITQAYPEIQTDIQTWIQHKSEREIQSIVSLFPQWGVHWHEHYFQQKHITDEKIFNPNNTKMRL